MSTGLNSYVLQLGSGEYVYDAATKRLGYYRESAQAWLWEPELVAERTAEFVKRWPWAGKLTAVRARP